MDNSEIQTTTIKNVESFIKLRTEWNDLLKETGNQTPFIRHEWLSAWWTAYGKDKELCVVCFKKGGRLVGFIPLMRYQSKFLGMNLAVLGFMANHWVELDIVATAAEREDCLKNFLKMVQKEKRMVILSHFCETSPVFERWLELLSQASLKFKLKKMSVPYIKLEDSWEGYLKKRTYRFRAEYKKKFKSLKEKGTYQLVRYQKNSDFNDALKQAEEIVVNSWQGKNGVAILSQEEGKFFYQELIKTWGPLEQIDISILKLDDKPLAYLIGFIAEGCFHVFDTGYDDNYKNDSPGMVIHNLLLEILHSSGLKEFNFGYMADYKKRWTEDARVISDCLIFAKGPMGEVLWQANRLKERIKNKKVEVAKD